MTALLLVAAGSALGAPARFVVDQFIQCRHKGVLPWGTWVINVSGCFLLGLLTGGAGPLGLDPLVVTAAGTGFLGAYTTFSTFTWDTIRLVEDGAWPAAARYVTLSVVAGAAAMTAGVAVGTLV